MICKCHRCGNLDDTLLLVRIGKYEEHWLCMSCVNDLREWFNKPIEHIGVGNDEV